MPNLVRNLQITEQESWGLKLLYITIYVPLEKKVSRIPNMLEAVTVLHGTGGHVLGPQCARQILEYLEAATEHLGAHETVEQTRKDQVDAH